MSANNANTSLTPVDSAIAVGHIPSGLFIVAATNGQGKIDGFLASWVSQVSFQPLLVTLALAPGRPAADMITSGAVFSINVVGEHDTQYLRYFWRGQDPNNSPWGELATFTSPEGGVVLLAARSTMICQTQQQVATGDHLLVIAKVLASYGQNAQANSKIHVRKTGSTY